MWSGLKTSALWKAGLIVPALTLTFGASTVSGTVLYFDGFEDGDRNNDGVINSLDADVAANDDDVPAPPDPTVWSPSTNAATVISDITTANDVNDVGIRWFTSNGFTGDNKPKANIKILDDSAAGPLVDESVHLDSGYALMAEGVGRSTSFTGHFDDDYSDQNEVTVALGPNVGDSIKMSFDWRIMEGAPASNTPALPDLAQFRFGFFNDADGQLGTLNPIAGPDNGNQPATWGEEDGKFRGDLAPFAGAQGDPGWFAKLFIGTEQAVDPDGIPASGDEFTFNGDLSRVVEDINDAANSRFLEGSDQDTVATPGAGVMPLLQVGSRYNISLELKRATDVSPGDSIEAIVTVTDLDTLVTSSFSGIESTDPMDTYPGPQSDEWHYVGFRNSSGDPEQDFDYIIDNFMIEMLEEAANIPGDADCDGDVDLDDFNILAANFGTGPESVGALPEPASLALLGLGALAATSRRRK